MTYIGKNVYFDGLDDIVDKYNDSYHRSIKMKHKDVREKKDPKVKVGYHVRISKYKNVFSKGYTPNWSEEVFVINKVQNTVPWTYLIMI